MPQINRWSSRLNFILAATGAAVGLGSIWKFPYMAGNNGGGAFVLVLILATVFVGIPVMMAEILLGRIGRDNPVSTMQKLAQQTKQHCCWQFLGWWGALALLLVLSFYSVIAGWSVAYMLKTWSGYLVGLSPLQIMEFWQEFLCDPLELMIWHGIFMIMTLWVVAKGIQAGLEKASKIMMPGLLLVLIILMTYSVYAGNFMQALHFLLYPDFSKLNHQVMLNALGQAFFSLAIGAGCMLTYGAYVPDNTKIGTSVCIIASLIIIISLLSGFAIFPIVFAFDVLPEGGPDLMFKVLPIAFNQMPSGMFFGGLFFLMLWFAAWTSSISMAEPLVIILVERFKITRKSATVIIGVIAWFLGLLSLFSFNILRDYKIFTYNLFDAVAGFATNIILPTGALGFAIFAGWILSAKDTRHAMKINARGFAIWQFLIKYIAPIGIVAIIL